MANQQISTADCEFDKARKILLVSHRMISGGFPAKIDVLSVHTGKVVTFTADHEAAERAEYWDGEEMHYVPVGNVPNVVALVIHKAY